MLSSRARPLFCDIDPSTFNLSAAAVESFIAERCEARGPELIHRASGARVRAMMPVHLYGQVAHMDALSSVAARHGLKMIEDAAQAIGAEDAAHKRAGGFGDVGCLSFFPTKNLGAFGDAGMCVANDAALAERMEILRVHGGKPKYYHAFIGGNFRLDELQAAVLNIKLKHLDEWSAGRQRNAAYYDEAFARKDLTGTVKTPHATAGVRHIYNQYVIRARDRNALRAHLTAQGIGTEIYYALPIYPELAEAQLQYVVDSIAGYYRR